MSERPFLFLDVDGPLNPFAAKAQRRPAGYETHRILPPSFVKRCRDLEPWRTVKPLRVWLNPAHGPLLLSLADKFDLVWATTWEREANEFIGPRIGLPELPVVEWFSEKNYGPEGTYFKTSEVVRYADGRPFAWVDDLIRRNDRSWVAENVSQPSLLHQVDPAIGLKPADIVTLRDWAESLL
ncbi:HAD domain-containing protein [Nocardia sp. NPDC056611]|uniref:HAD domain-containing protein n=1 Tax=Nocardia sp. NPDC056611 TaxID=3345877 RepID=UPI00366D68DB